MNNTEIYKNLIFMTRSHPSALLIRSISTDQLKHVGPFHSKKDIQEAFYKEAKRANGNAVVNFRMKEKERGFLKKQTAPKAKGMIAVLPSDLYEEIMQGRR